VACEGLRTLCLAWKELNERDYRHWSKKVKQAASSMENREEQVDNLYEEIEKNMLLIGMTAIEDKLQDGVPECIENLSQAGIKIWMLTGDKTGTIKKNRFSLTETVFCSLETAENIGLSCRLLTDEMILKKIEGDTNDDVNTELDQFRTELIEKIEEIFGISIDKQTERIRWKDLKIDANDFGGFCLLITGPALVHALSDELKMKFLELSTMCKTIICCRVTPLQKAQVVELVMKNDDVVTLAIGDGANDVSMIQSELKICVSNESRGLYLL
jgi:phospholipid-translocating ATPase